MVTTLQAAAAAGKNMKHPSGFGMRWAQGMHDEIRAFDCDDPAYFHDLSYWHLDTINEITSQQPAEKLGKPPGPC